MQRTQKRYGTRESSESTGGVPSVNSPGKGSASGQIQAKASGRGVIQRLADDSQAAPAEDVQLPTGGSFASAVAGHGTLTYGYADKSVVESMQTLLNGLGHDVGTVDGMWGPATSRGVRGFQQAAGLVADAVVGALTKAALIASETTGSVQTGNGNTGNTTGGEHTTGGGGETGTGTGGETGGATGNAELGGLEGAFQSLLEGGFKRQGGYSVGEGDSFGGFENGDLQSLLDWYLANWENVSNPNAPTEDTMGKGAGGHTGGGQMGSHPRWMSGFQNKLMGLQKAAFDEKARGAQALCQAYLNAWAAAKIGSAGPDSSDPGAVGSSHSGVEEFFNNVGASESNEQATALGGYKDGVNWCAEASNKACIMGLMRRGLRFKAVKPWSSQPVQIDIARQAAHIVNKWSKQGGGRIEGCKGDEELLPGDYISIIGQGPVSGHAATVVYADPPTGEGTIHIVSGNAAGVRAMEGAVRVEQVERERQPDNYNWFKAMAKNNGENNGYTGPLRPQPGVVWLVSVVRLSQLDANVLLAGTEDSPSSELLEQHGLEKFDLVSTFGKTPQMMKYLKQAFKDI